MKLIDHYQVIGGSTIGTLILFNSNYAIIFGLICLPVVVYVYFIKSNLITFFTKGEKPTP